MSSQALKFVVIALLLATSSLSVVAQDQASDVDKITQREVQPRAQKATTNKQVKTLIASAKAAEDHMKLTAYFNQEADRMEADAKGHEELADVYRQNPNATGGGKQSGTGLIFRTAEHRDSAARSLREAAEGLRELAAEH
jgi:hypothetical protein